MFWYYPELLRKYYFLVRNNVSINVLNIIFVCVALRKTMLRAHRQAWAWQDEWYGLTMDDIRQIERQTQEALKMTMSGV